EGPVRGTDAGQANSRHSYSLSLDGRQFGYGDGEKFFLHDAESGKRIQAFPQLPTRTAMLPAFAPDGKAVALPAGQEKVTIFDVATGKEILTVDDEKEM